MQKTKSFITGQQHIQGINRKLLSLMLLAFIFITNTVFSATSAGQEPLSIKVGAYANHPKIFMDADGKVSGFWPDFIENIAKKENWKIEYIWGTWSEGLDHLINKEIAIMPDVAFTEKRNELYTFSEAPVLMSWTRVYVNKEKTEIQSIRDLKNKKIAVLKGSVNLEGSGGLREIALGFNLNCTFLELDNYKEVFKAVEKNRVDAGITNRNFGNKNAKNFKVKKTPIIFQPINMKFVFPKDAELTPYLAERINYHIKKLKQDENSIYYQLLEKYFEAQIAEKTVEVFPWWLEPVLKSITALFIFFIFVIIASRIQVKRKTNEIMIDITERKQTEKKLRRANRALKTFSECNQAVVRAREEAHLLHEICRIIVDIGGYRLAWVGFARQDEAKTVQPVAQSGYEEGYLDKLNITWADTARGRGPTGTAIRAGKPIVVKNILADPNYTPWRAEASKRGYESAIALPLISDDQAFGTLNIYAEEPDAFDAEEIKLLMELTDDLAYGIMALRTLFEHKQAEKALKESEEKYRAMMEAMKELVYICSSDYRIEYMNPTMIKRTGRDATGEICFKTLHNLDKKCPWCMHDKVQASEHVESDIVSPKDNRSYHVSQTPIVHGDGSVSNMTVFRDTTDLIKLESQLRQAQKMEAIGSLAGGIAHDFNNVLFAIIGYTELSMAAVPEGSNARKNLREVLKAADRAKDMVQQILTFSRKTEKVKKPISVQSVLKEAVNLIKTSLPSTIEIRQDIDADCGPVMADPTQIHEIIMNLGTNAYHAMREKGGILGITLRQEEIGFDDSKYDLNLHPGEYLKLIVEDTGHGIDANIMGKIFDPYFTTKSVEEGTGMGLSIVHGIVMDHGGDIRVYGEPGKGTAFQIYLPLIKTASVEQEIISAGSVPTGTERILLIDDEEQIVQMIQQILESLGYHVTPRTSSVETFEAFRAKPDKFDLVITDMTMPNMTGAELATRLLEIRSDIPIILCTGFSELMDKKKANAIGIREYVMKPVIRDKMARTIRKVLDERNE